MERLQIKIENCYGIKCLEKDFSFSESRAHAIYAKNGLMKTSLAKIFKNIQDKKSNEIKDLYFPDLTPAFSISIDGDTNISDKLLVVKSYESSYESQNITTLLLNDNLSDTLVDVLKLREKLFKEIEKLSGLKISRVVSGKKVFELEQTIIADFEFENKSVLLNLDSIEIENLEFDFSEIQYSTIFDPTNIKKIQSASFQEGMKKYLLKVYEIYDKHNFLEKGNFTLPKLKEVQKRLKSNNFFARENRILLEGETEAFDETKLQKAIKEISKEITETDEFAELEKILSDVKGIQLKDTIENHPEIVSELIIENIPRFKIKLWLSYIKKNEELFSQLVSKFTDLQDSISKLDKDDTPWHKALKIFNNRFSLPFKMSIENVTSTIIGESLPKVIFSFNKYNNFSDPDPENWAKLYRDELEEIDTLSQGEKRALYLLNIIFDIEVRKSQGLETLFILDDIADSFDYKNKYAIVEYMNDIIKEDNFHIIFLSHNFDFYRTFSSRLALPRENRYTASKDTKKITISQEHYQKQPFENWKEILKARSRYGHQYSTNDAKKHIIAIVPFLRNLIEFGIDRHINQLPEFKSDYNLLTSILHLKKDTGIIEITHLKELYKEYLGKDDFDSQIRLDTKIFDIVEDLALNHISIDSHLLEDKIVLSIYICLVAEKFMIDKISDRIFCESIDGVQTRMLYNKYLKMFPSESNNIAVLERVNILTPENIHLNSFMYEPILDVDIGELRDLCEEVQKLC